MTDLNEPCEFSFGVHIERTTPEGCLPTSERTFDSYRRRGRNDNPGTSSEPTLIILYSGLILIPTEQHSTAPFETNWRSC